MTTTVKAIYENGVLKLSKPLPLPEKALVTITIRSNLTADQDVERGMWLKLSEEALTKTWENSGDDIFNELLKK